MCFVKIVVIFGLFTEIKGIEETDVFEIGFVRSIMQLIICNFTPPHPSPLPSSQAHLACYDILRLSKSFDIFRKLEYLPKILSLIFEDMFTIYVYLIYQAGFRLGNVSKNVRIF